MSKLWIAIFSILLVNTVFAAEITLILIYDGPGALEDSVNNLEKRFAITGKKIEKVKTLNQIATTMANFDGKGLLVMPSGSAYEYAREFHNLHNKQRESLRTLLTTSWSYFGSGAGAYFAGNSFSVPVVRDRQTSTLDIRGSDHLLGIYNNSISSPFGIRCPASPQNTRAAKVKYPREDQKKSAYTFINGGAAFLIPSGQENIVALAHFDLVGAAVIKIRQPGGAITVLSGPSIEYGPGNADYLTSLGVPAKELQIVLNKPADNDLFEIIMNQFSFSGNSERAI